MNDEFAAREERWTPKPRPDWVRRLNEEGSCLDIKSVVPLDPDSLMKVARANTGLNDFDGDDWVEPFMVLTRSFDEESRLNLMGRILTRNDMLMYLEARLRIADTYKRHPEIEEEEIRKPLMIIGQGRSGTSALQSMLSRDPRNETITNWEVFFPCPPPEKATYHSDPRIAKVDRLFRLIRDVIPEIDAMHEFTAEMPTENIHLHCLSFRGVPWINSFGGQVPSFNAYMAKQSLVPMYQYEKRVLKLLQWTNQRDWWLLKSPPSIMHIPEVLEVYPDMCFTWIHRDPVKAISSMTNLIGTLFWCRTDHPFIGNSLEAYTRSDIVAAKMNQPIDWLENGVLPRERLCNLQYSEFIDDPMRVARQLYDYFDIAMPPESERALRSYADEVARESRPAHRYDTGDSDLIRKERALYARYQEYFRVPNEI